MQDVNGQALIANAEQQIMLLAAADQQTGSPRSRVAIEDWHDTILNLEDAGRGQASAGYDSLVGNYRQWADAWRERSQARKLADAASPCGNSRCQRCNAGKHCPQASR